MTDSLWHRAVKRETGQPSAWVAWALRIAFVGIAYWATTVPPGQTTGPGTGFLAMVVGVLALILIADLAPTERPWLLKWTESTVYVILGLNVLGFGFGWFASIPWYDHLLHFVLGAAFVLIVYTFAAAFDWTWLWRYGSPLATGVHAFTVAMTLGVFIEFVEASADTFAGTSFVTHFLGSTIDLAYDAAGALLASVIAAFTANHREEPEPTPRARGGRPTGE